MTDDATIARHAAALNALDRILVNGAPLNRDDLPDNHPTITITEPRQLGPAGPWTFPDPDPDA